MITTALLLVLAACAPVAAVNDEEPALIELPDAWIAQARLAVGKHWIEPGIARTQAIDVTVPGSANAVTAFVDLDGDETIDPVVEPTAPCARRGARWYCRLEPETLVRYRVDEVSSEVSTQFLPVPKLFGATEPVPETVEACIGDRTGCISPWIATPWSSEEAQEASACTETAPVVWLRSTGSAPEGRAVAAPTPQAIVADISVSRGVGDAIQIDVTTEYPTDRQIIWIERDGEWVWSSEREPTTIDSSGRHVAMEIPAVLMAECPECSPWLGLATQRNSSSDGVFVLVVSELRVDLREGGFL